MKVDFEGLDQRVQRIAERLEILEERVLPVKDLPVPLTVEWGLPREEMIELYTRFTRVLREADQAYEQSGGSTRHFVIECLFPILERHGLSVIDTNKLRELEKSLTRR